MSPTPRPFLKWVGGKTQLLPELVARVPLAPRRYHEPFLGGGALFFELARLGRMPRRAALNAPWKPELVDARRAVNCDGAKRGPVKEVLVSSRSS